ncbi:MAG: hypothetical protein QF807_02150 [Candidatus Thalassarchaeaceae archaeon]|nr:hypothetical protein [Candidatus Thalassarchaeaceae archaeon]
MHRKKVSMNSVNQNRKVTLVAMLLITSMLAGIPSASASGPHYVYTSTDSSQYPTGATVNTSTESYNLDGNELYSLNVYIYDSNQSIIWSSSINITNTSNHWHNVSVPGLADDTYMLFAMLTNTTGNTTSDYVNFQIGSTQSQNQPDCLAWTGSQNYPSGAVVDIEVAVWDIDINSSYLLYIEIWSNSNSSMEWNTTIGIQSSTFYSGTDNVSGLTDGNYDLRCTIEPQSTFQDFTNTTQFSIGTSSSGGGDHLEPNDDPANGTVISPNWFSNNLSIHFNNDYDIFIVNISAGQNVWINLTFNHSSADIDFDVYDQNQSAIGGAYSSSDDESFSFTTTYSGWYLIDVYAYGGTASYTFSIETSSSPSPGNNSSNNTDCLSNNTPTGVLTELFVWTDGNIYNVGDTTTGTFFVNCTVIGEDYELYYELEDSNGVIMDSGWWNWTATQNTWIMTMNWNLPEHIGYCLTGTLSMSGVWIDMNPWCPIDVIGNNTQPGGGNNTGGNNSGNQSDCGTLNNLTELDATLYNSPFYVWESISSNWVGICTVIGQDYMLEAFLEDDASTITVPSQIYWMDWYNFTATSSWEFIGNAIFTGLNPGGYCINSTLYEMPGEVFVDHVYSCFTVIDYPTGGNNNGSGNSSSNPLLPGNTTNNSGSTTFNFNFTVSWGEPIWVDPFVAIGYDYEISDGPNFASVMIPFAYGDGMFDIYLWDGTNYAYTGISIATGTHYSFQSGGVDRFSIRGIEVSAEVDPDDPEGFVTSLTFVNSGNVDMAMIPITIFVDDNNTEVPCTDDCPELISGDTDGDGVPNEWDDCPETVEGAATDSNGCEVTTETSPPVDGGEEEGGGLPGFTGLLAIASLACIALLRPRRHD